MKKNRTYGLMDKIGLLKMITIMRFTIFILFLSLSQAFAVDSYSQQTKLSLDLKNAKVEDVLDKIEKSSEFFFMYNKGMVDVERKVDIQVEEKSVNEVLDKIFANTGITYSIKDRQILLINNSMANTGNESVAQQQKSISGKVSDSTGASLPGVSVVVKGTTTGVITDSDGKYILSKVPESATLQFSFVGMKTQEVKVNGKTSIDITLVEEPVGIEEVVAIGYGTVKKSDLTGSVTKVNMVKMAEQSNVSIIQSLQGSIAGLNVGAVDAVGENPSLSIRGQNTLSSNSSDDAPLIVVDGAIYYGSIIDLNTNDFESVDILKDASSAAIYGSQASNGVIIFTSKKGKDLGKPVIRYSGSYTIQVPSNNLTPMNSKEYENFYSDTFWAEGSRLAPDYLKKDESFSFIPHLPTSEIAKGYADGLDNNWWGMLTGNGYINTHNLSVQGQNNSINYFLSSGFTDEKGYLINDTYKKYNYRINLDAKINEWMKVGVESFLTSSNYSGISPSSSQTFTLQPWAPIYDNDGKYIVTVIGSTINPFLTIKEDDSDKRFNLFSNLYSDIKLPFLPGFNYKINYSQNYRTTNQDSFNPYGANYTGTGNKNSYIYYDWSLDNIINYQKSFNKHSINLTLVYGMEESNMSYTKSTAQNFSNDQLGYNRLQAGTASLNSILSGKEKESSIYTMGRLLYNYNNKYLLTGTIRRDGYSGFGSNNKIGIFPSVALGWVASEESFIKDNVSWLNYLKVRGSYGSTGRRGSGRYDTLAKVDAKTDYVFGDGSTATIGQWISSMANNDLGWETTTGINLAVDYGILKSRVRGSIEYYQNHTKDILYNIELPTMTGFNGIKTNIGKVKNHGIELTLSGKIIDRHDFSWEASFNFARNRNEIESILGHSNDSNGDGKEDNLTSNRLFIGEPQNVIYDYEIIGMWQLADKEKGIIPAGFFPGTYKIYSEDSEYSAADKKILGYNDPSYSFGIANTFNYKNFSLYIFINSIQGGKKYYMGDDSPYSSGLWSKLDQLIYNNIPSGAWDYWMPENPNAKYRRLDLIAPYEARPYGQRSFIRLQDVSLSYTLRSVLIKKLDLQSLKIFMSGKNLLTLTDWKGWDPETGVGFGAGRPVMRNYTFGVNVEF